MKYSNLTQRGITLIELMIVITLLAILAAMVIPTFSNANETAKSSAVSSQVQTIKKALTLYKTDHNGAFPTDAQMITSQWQALINSTDIDGDTAGTDYGPYFQKPPFNAFMDSNVVAADNSAAWQYDSSTGTIQAVVQDTVYTRAEDLQLEADDLVVAP